MAEQGARHIVLVGRTGLPDRVQWPSLAVGSRAANQAATIEAIEALGAAVHIFAMDVGDREQVQALINRFGESLPPLRGLVHAAADLSTWDIEDMPAQAFQAMVQAKATSAWWLHELTQEYALDFFVLFSSTTGVWGSRGMAHYAAANHMLDALAHYRHAHGLPALSIDWGTWDEMRIASDEERDRVARFGLRPMPSDDALGILGDLLGNDAFAQIIVADVDWARLRPAYEARRAQPLLSNIAPSARTHTTPAKPQQGKHGKPGEQAALLRQLDQVRPEEQLEIVLDHVRVAVARTLNLDTNRPIDIRQGLFEMGMDSLMSVELKGRLEASVGQTLPSTLTFNYPSIETLAGYLSREVLGLAQVGHERHEPAEQPTHTAQDTTNDANAFNINNGMSEDELAELLAAKLARLQE
jgi:myxalamid-type polyketide synthase MxaE and MxaD